MRHIRPLSPGEVEVAKLAAEGLSNVEIAAQLGLRRGTVRGRLDRVYLKLGLRNRTQLARWVVAEGLAIPTRELHATG